MEWQEDDAEQQEGYVGGVERAVCFEHDPPPLPAARPHKQGKREQAPTAEELARKQLLAAHPALYAGEPEEYRLRRADAADACWAALSSKIKETLGSTDAQVFADLLAFARAHHKDPEAAACLSQDGYHRVPTGLVLAGGVNSADHSQTFPKLAAHFKEQGLYVALLQPHSFGRVAGDALNEVLRQFSGLDTQATHIEALLAWYRNEVGEPATTQAAPAVAAAAAGPGSKRQQQQQQLKQQAGAKQDGVGEQQQQQQQGRQQRGRPGKGKGKEGDQEEGADRRQLRERPATATTTAAAAGGAGGSGGSDGGSKGAGELQRANWGRPLVIVVEGTEAVDIDCIRDVLQTLSESYAQLPVAVILGLTTSEGALHDMLTSEIVDRCMDHHSFKLASAMARMNRLVGEVLLGGAGGWPGLAFAGGVAGTLVDKFFAHYFSTGILEQGLQLAAIDHFAHQPASFLAAAALEGEPALRAACAQLPSPVAAKVREALGGGRGAGAAGAKLADVVLEALAGWRCWAVALHWLAAAGKAAGLAGKFQYYRLLRDGLASQFAATETGKGLGELERQLRQLKPEQVAQLAGELQAAAVRVVGAEAVLRGELEQLQAFASCGTTEPAQQAQQAQRDGGGDEGEGGAAAAATASGGGGAEEAPAAAGSAAAGARARREVFHSKASRRQALIKNAAQAATGAKTAAAAAAAKKAQAAAAPGARFAVWLLGVLKEVLAAPPSKLPGAAVFTCSRVGVLASLSGAPRQAVHGALTAPHHFLGGPEEEGASAGMEDACLAYTLLDQDRNCENVADWFQAFCDVHAAAEEQAQQGAGAGGRKGKKAAVKRKRGKEAAEEEAGPSEDAKRAKQRELAARFSQATAELQLAGLIKPAKKRRGDFVQRLVHMPAEPE